MLTAEETQILVVDDEGPIRRRLGHMLRENCGQDGRDGFIQVKFHKNGRENGSQSLDSRGGSSASYSAISRLMSSRWS